MKQYIVLVNFQISAPIDMTHMIEAKLNELMIDWLRLSMGQYIVNTAVDENYLYLAIKPLLNAGDYLMVIELNLKNRRGWATNLAIEWIKRVSP